MRLAFVTDGITPYVMGGMQRHSFNLARHLARLGVSIDLYHTDKGSNEDIHQLLGMEGIEKSNIHSIRIPWPDKGRLPGHYLRELSAYSEACLQEFLQRPPVDFIYTKGLTGQAFIRARKGNEDKVPPVGLKAHGYEMFQPAPDFKSSLQFLLLRRSFKKYSRAADLTFSYGGKITAILREQLQIPSTQIAEIPGAVANDWLGSTPKSNKAPFRKFIFVGRFERRKGIQELQQVILENPEWGKFARFTFVGPIPEAVRLSLPYVKYLGKVSDHQQMLSILGEHQIMITPSHSEGMPNVIMEGMASGLAPIATDVGAVSALVSSETGWLIPPADNQQLVAAINQAISLPELELHQLRLQAQALVQSRFTWDAVGKQTLKKIQQFLSKTT